MKQNLTKLFLVVMLLPVCMLILTAQAQDVTKAPAGTATVSAPPEPSEPDMLYGFHHPAPWLDMGADLRFREHAGFNWTGLDDDKVDAGGKADHNFHFQRWRTRWWTTIKLNDDTTINTRMTWEFRTWDEPESKTQSTDGDEFIIDNLNFKQKNFIGLPTTLIIGRQDMILGQGWLVADGTPLDGSRTFYYDALRFTWDLGEKTKLDTVYIHNRPESDWWLKPFNDREKYVTQEKEDGAILYLTDKSNPTQLEGYFMYKHNYPVDTISGRAFTFSQNAVNAFSKTAEIYTFGGAASAPINDNWNYRVEGAIQTGRSASPNSAVTENDHTKDLFAYGTKDTIEYCFKDEVDNRLHLTFEYLSGDNPDTDTVTSFNPLWGQWPQWSELYQPYVTQLEDNLVSNLYRFNVGHKFKPCKQLEILTDYHVLWADENTYRSNTTRFTDNGSFRGHLLTCLATDNINKNLKGNFVAEYLWPGNYYAQNNRDNALYFHWTVEYTF